MPLKLVDRAIIWAIGKLPTAQAKETYRLYNRALIFLRKEYMGKTFFGAAMHCDLDDAIQSYIFHFGVWEPEVSEVIASTLSAGDVFIDIGANVGYDSLLGSWRVGPTGRVVAIEASPTTFDLLKKNFALDGNSGNIRAINIAVSDRCGTLDLFEISKWNIGATTTLAGRGGRRVASVEAMPLTDILTPDELSRVRLIKIDVEGAETGILTNILENMRLFPRTMDLIVETSFRDDPDASLKLFSAMKAAGFTAYEIANDYAVEHYLTRTLSPIVKADTLPQKQCDLLYTRYPEVSPAAQSAFQEKAFV